MTKEQTKPAASIDDAWDEANEGVEIPTEPDDPRAMDDDDDDDQEPEGDKPAGESHVEPEGKADQQTKPATQADAARAAAEKRPWAGRFKTPEEMEQHLLKVERGEDNGQPQPPAGERADAAPADELADLTDEELVTLAEHDDSDGTKHYEAYFRHKMARRKLQPFEVKALKEFDARTGSDLYGDYRDIQAERRTMERIAPVVRPMAERQQKESREEFAKREQAIDADTAKEFGKDFDGLRKQSTNVEFIEKVLANSPTAPAILAMQERSPATAHRMLLREIREFNKVNQEKVTAEKRKKSVPADVGGSGRRARKDSAASIEDAWDASLAEDPNQ